MQTRLVTARKGLIAMTVVALTMTAVPLAMAQGGGGGRGGRGMGRGGPGAEFGRMAFGLRQLDLSDAQRTQIRTIMQSRRDEFKALGEKARAARNRLQDAVRADSVNEEAIRTASGDLAQVQADIAVLRARVHQEVVATLTPEQQQQAKQLRAEAEKRRDERRQRMEQRLKERRQRQAK